MAAFLDTNILFYAFADTTDRSVDKSAIAKALIANLTQRNELIVSAQVLSEFAANAIKKGNPPLHAEEAAAIVERLGRQTVITTDASLVLLALQRVQLSRISYWDALIVEAAIRSGAATYTPKTCTPAHATEIFN